MKAKAKVYKGIEFIGFTDLPVNQQRLLEHAQEPERIKILIDGKIIENCFHYREYSQWYTAIYSQSVAPVMTPVEEAIEIKVSLQKA